MITGGSNGAGASLVVLLLGCLVLVAATQPDIQHLPQHKVARESYDSHPLVKFLSAVRDVGPVTACPPVDHTLPLQPPDRKARYLFAAILTNADRLMPQLLIQLLPALLTLPRSHVCVSIYESGSYDATPAWLHLLQAALDSLRIPNTIVTGGSTKSLDDDRIAHLARLRNHALAPLFHPPTHPHPPPTEPPTPPAPFPADHIIYLNDVAFCAQDVLRLLQHAPSTDIACGIDLQNWAGSSDATPANMTALAALLPPRMPPLPRGLRSYLLTLWQDHFQLPPTENLTPPLQFYDNWVGHDLDGRGLRVEYPYANVPASRARSEAGLPFPVQCCWNGLAVLRAAPFRAGLRFRSHVAGECYESECTLLCDDFWRLGYTRVLIDPSVRVTYCPSLYPYAHAPDRPTSNWRQALSDPVNWAKVAPPNRTECCEGSDWAHCKHHFPWLDKNYTDVAIKSGYAPSNVCYAINTSKEKCPVPALLAQLATSPAAATPPAAAANTTTATQQAAPGRALGGEGWVRDGRRRRRLHGMTGVPR